MAEVTANGLVFHVMELRDQDAQPGTRPAVVMLHGLVADNLSSYYYTIANPVAQIADVHLYDLRGHGRSEMPATGYTVADNVDDLDALLTQWGLADRTVHLVGNSFGGVIALAFADRFPERVASLFLIEAHFPIEGWGEHMAGSLALASFGLDEAVAQKWMADQQGERKLKRLARRAQTLFLETSLIDDLNREKPVTHEALAAIRCPVFAVYGEESDILDRARDLERHVPDIELHVVAGVAHSVLTDADALVRDHARRWFARFA